MIRRFAVLLGASVFAATACIPFNFGGTLGADRVWIDPDTGAWYREGDPDPIWTGPWEQDAYAVPADYDGDGLTDPAVYLDGVWTIEGVGTIEWPAPAAVAVPVPADYDSDGDGDPAFYDETDGRWYLQGQDPVTLGSPAHAAQQGGGGNFQYDALLIDIALPGDYDGDGDDERAVWQMDGGAWIIEGEPAPIDPGWPPGFPIPADYTAAPGLELGLWDPIGAAWYIEGHDPVSLPAFTNEVRPTALDHDADGFADIGFALATEWVVVGVGGAAMVRDEAVTGPHHAVQLGNALPLVFLAQACDVWFAEAVGQPWENQPPSACT